MDRILNSPVLRISLSIVLGGYSAILLKEAINNVEILEKRIEAMEKLKSDFVASGGLVTFETCNMQEAEEKEGRIESHPTRTQSRARTSPRASREDG